MLCSQAVPLEAALLAGDAKPQAHISDSQLQATEVSPRHLVTGFRQESLKAATPEGLTLERAAPGVLPALILLLFHDPLPAMQTQTPRSHVTHAALFASSTRVG